METVLMFVLLCQPIQGSNCTTFEVLFPKDIS